jgi:hypothetical protein
MCPARVALTDIKVAATRTAQHVVVEPVIDGEWSLCEHRLLAEFCQSTHRGSKRATTPPPAHSTGASPTRASTDASPESPHNTRRTNGRDR